METATLALLLSVLNLLFLLYTTSTNRRSAQLQKLADMRTKASSLKYSMSAFLVDLEVFWVSIERLDQGASEIVKQNLDELERVEECLKIAFDEQSWLSLFSYPVGRIEEIDHQLDSVAVRFEVLTKGMLHRTKEIHMSETTLPA